MCNAGMDCVLHLQAEKQLFPFEVLFRSLQKHLMDAAGVCACVCARVSVCVRVCVSVCVRAFCQLELSALPLYVARGLESLVLSLFL